MDVGMWGTPLFSLAYPELMLPLYPLLFIFSPPYIPCTMYKTVRGLEVYSQLVDWVAWGKHDSHDEHKNPLQSSLPPSLPLFLGVQERQGVCIGLSEIIQQTSRDHVLLYMDSLLPTVRNSLCDVEEEVRAAAAQTFNSLHSTIGLSITKEREIIVCMYNHAYL